MARGQRDKLIAPAGEERVGADRQRVGAVAGQARKSRLDIVARAGVQDVELQPEARAAARLPSPWTSAIAVARVDEQARSYVASGTSSRSSSSRFGPSRR